jgi:hypothetical protein
VQICPISIYYAILTIGFEQFSQLVLNKVHFLGGLIHFFIQFSDIFMLHVYFLADALTLLLKALGDLVYLVEMLILLLHQFILHALHFGIN